MSPTRRLARPMLASMFVAGGIDSLRHPGPRVEAARGAGLSSPEQLVRANAATQLVVGLMLATNRAPRLSALVLAGSLVPTTYVGHPFWTEKDKAVRSQQQTQFLKNLGLLGGLLLAVADTGGRESVPHAAGRLSRQARKDAKQAAGQASKRAAKVQKKAAGVASRAAQALPHAS